MSCFLCLAVLEGASQYIFRDTASVTVHTSSEFEYDNKLGWRAKRQWQGKLQHGRYPVEIDVSINGDGFRDEDWDEKIKRAQARNKQKVLLIGDSILYGFAGRKDDRLSESLATQYGAEVFNAGIPGFGTAQQHRLLPELLARINPDLVLVVFCFNDYADTGLPFDHRYPFRVYKPFYDSAGRLLFNDEVPRRPSLWARSTPFGNLSLWLSLDRVSDAMHDVYYRRANVLPEPEDLLYFGEWENFFFDESLRNRYPHVEATVLTLFDQMRKSVEAAGGRFLVVSTSVRANERLTEKLANRAAFIPFPDNIVDDLWFEIPFDGHLNFVWSSLLASQIAGVVKGEKTQWSWSAIDKQADWQKTIDFSDPASVKYLTGGWEFAAGNRNFLATRRAGALFANPGGVIEVTGYAKGNIFGKIEVSIPGVQDKCSEVLARALRRFSCRFPAIPSAVLPIEFTPATPGLELSLLAVEVRSGS